VLADFLHPLPGILLLGLQVLLLLLFERLAEQVPLGGVEQQIIEFVMVVIENPLFGAALDLLELIDGREDVEGDLVLGGRGDEFL
jgi:hypothetical protein